MLYAQLGGLILLVCHHLNTLLALGLAVGARGYERNLLALEIGDVGSVEERALDLVLAVAQDERLELPGPVLTLAALRRIDTL
jgi:hypothetical protein